MAGETKQQPAPVQQPTPSREAGQEEPGRKPPGGGEQAPGYGQPPEETRKKGPLPDQKW